MRLLLALQACCLGRHTLSRQDRESSAWERRGGRMEELPGLRLLGLRLPALGLVALLIGLVPVIGPVPGAARANNADAIAAPDSPLLRVGLATAPTSLDPHAFELIPNYALHRHLFDRLTELGRDLRLQPGLATAWTDTGDREWVFTLRQGARFQNGAEVTAGDIIFSLCRAKGILDSPTPFSHRVRDIVAARREGRDRLVLTTLAPNPMLPRHLASVVILSARALGADPAAVHLQEGQCRGLKPAHGSSHDDSRFLGAWRGAGSGPYRLETREADGRLILKRFADYWGGPALWQTVHLVPIADDTRRLRLLLAGALDVIEKIPPEQRGLTQRHERLRTVVIQSNRVIFLGLNFRPQPTPSMAEATDGTNALRDWRVRRALSRAIDRTLLVSRALEGMARPVSQMAAPGAGGLDPALPIEPHDPKEARLLLTLAGYPNGLPLRFGAPNDRYIKDAQVAEAIAAMLRRSGLEPELELLPSRTYFPKAAQGAYDLWLAGWGSNTGSTADPLRTLLATRNPETGLGGGNFGRYSNSVLDQLLHKAFQTAESAERDPLLQKASRLVVRDYAALPLYVEMASWAMTRSLLLRGRVNQITLAMDVRPAL